MAIDLAPHNIQVNAIAPGWIETDKTAPVKTMPLTTKFFRALQPVDGDSPRKLLELLYI